MEPNKCSQKNEKRIVWRRKGTDRDPKQSNHVSNLVEAVWWYGCRWNGQRNGIFLNGHVSHLISNQQSSIAITQEKTKGRKNRKRGSHSGWQQLRPGQSNCRWGNSAFSNVCGPQILVNDFKGFSSKYLLLYV